MKKHLLLITLHLAALGADAFYTNRVANDHGFREHDPLVRPFVTHGEALRISYFVGDAALTLALDKLLRSKGHTTAADVLLATHSAASASGAVYSATHYRVK